MRVQTRQRRNRSFHGALLVEGLEGRTLMSVQAADFAFNALENTAKSVDLGAHVQDSASTPTWDFAVSSTTASGGTVTGLDAETGALTYNPPGAGFAGADTFSYSVTDTTTDETSNEASVQVNVASVAANPFIVNELEGQNSIAVDIANLPGAVQDIATNPNYTFSNIQVSGSTGGTVGVSNASTGAFTYTPPSSSFSGQVTISYQVSDSGGGTSSSFVGIDIAPVAANPAVWPSLEGQSTAVPSLADSIQDVAANPTYTFSDFTVPSGDGSVSAVDEGTGSFTYAPPSATFTGAVHIHFTVTDDNQNSSDGVITIDVAPIVASTVTWSGLEGQSTTVPSLVSSIQTVTDSPTYTFSGFTIATGQGSISSIDSGTGSFAYTPPSSTFTGPVDVHYTVTDNADKSANGDVTVDVQPVIADPVVWSDLEGQATDVPSLVGAVRDQAGSSTYSFSGFTIPAGEGSVNNVSAATGAFTYIPPSATFTGAVKIHYVVTDSSQESTSGEVTVNVAPIITDSIGVSGLENQPIDIPSLEGSVQDVAPDASYTFSNFTVPASEGTVSDADAATGSVTYNPPGPTFVGVVKLAYKVTDTAEYSATGVVTIDVAPAIVAENDGPFSVFLGQPLTIPAAELLSNDFAPNGAIPSIQSVQGANNGQVVLNPDGSITFTPDAVGQASFTYTDIDTAGDPSASATVTLAVLPPPSTPTPTPTPTPNSTPTSLVEIGEQPVFHRKLKRGKPVGGPILSGFALDFNVPLNAFAAANAEDYKVDMFTTKRVKKKAQRILQPITNFTVTYMPATDSVDITFAANETFGAGGQLTILDGLTSAAGGTLNANTAFTISKGGKNISPST